MDINKLHEKFSIFPVNKDKSPKHQWGKYRKEKIELEKALKHNGYFGIVCGWEHLEVLDIDNHYLDADKLLEALKINFDLSKYCIIGTQNGGFHIYYQCEHIEGNLVFAKRYFDIDDTRFVGCKIDGETGYLPDGSSIRLKKKGKNEITLVETRGDGGYVVFYDNILQGDVFDIPVISIKEREELHDLCRALNETEATKSNTNKSIQREETEKPGTIYNEDPSTVEETKGLLISAGWQDLGSGFWRRPGKEKGAPSATFERHSKGKFYVFSTNADPFESMQSYTFFGVRTILLHNNDFKECTKELAKRYDVKPEPKKETEKKNKIWDTLFQIITDWKLKFRMNELTKVMEYSQNGGPYQNGINMLYGDIQLEMETKRGIKSIRKSRLDEMICNRSICEIYNPINSFFERLPKWDGADHFKEFCKYIEPDRDENEDFFYQMLKKHFVRACRCALEGFYVNRMVLVLYSNEQNIGKSTFFKWCVPSEIYYEEDINPKDKDSQLALSRYLIINLEELDSLNKNDVSRLKAYISHGDISKRVAYGRHEEKFKRVASLVGSTNKSQLLTDTTNTRWVILKVKGFNWKEYIKKIDRNQLWSQAYAEFQKNKEAGELTKEEQQERDKRNNVNFIQTTEEREIIEKYFEEDTESYMTASDIKQEIEKHLYTVKINWKVFLEELKRVYGEPVMCRVGGKNGRYYNLRSTLTGMEMNTVTPVPVVDDEDVPF